MDSTNDPELRIQALKQPLWIGYARAVAIRQQMEELFNHPKMHRMPNIAVIGESNNGKSMLLNNFARRHDPTLAPGYSVNSDQIERPIFIFQAPPEPDEGRLYNRMLTELYAAGSDREPAESKLRRVSVLLKALKTRMVLIDEFGFFQAGTPMKQRKLLNALKFLGNELQIPIVVAAVPETLNLLQSDPQIANRFEPVFLPKWRMGEDYQKLLVTMEKTLGLRAPSNLAAEFSAQRLLDETNGIIGYMSELLQKLATDAIRTGVESITPNALKEANLKRLGWVHPNRRHRYTG
jgi:Bacterial TniB protein